MIEIDGFKMIELGDRVEKAPHEILFGDKANAITYGTVCYIHPEGRYYELEFKSLTRDTTFRESFRFTPEELEDAYALGVFKRPVCPSDKMSFLLPDTMGKFTKGDGKLDVDMLMALA